VQQYPLKRRATADQQVPFHRAGHSINHHPEDEPYSTDQAVGIDDSQSHPSHFIFENLDGQVLIIFFPGGDATHAKIYIGPQIFGQDATSLSVTGEFKADSSGRLDMIVHVGSSQQILYINTGTDFKLQK
jgi:hypothetical protein